MKVSLLLISLILLCGFSKAQDTIVFRNGEQVPCKVQKVSAADIEYKRADNLKGPTYVAIHDKVEMIKYENGRRDVFVISPTDTRRREERPDNRRVATPRQRVVKGIILTSIGSAMLAAGGATLIYGILEYEEVPIAVGAGLTAGGIPLTIVGSVTFHRGKKAMGKKKILFGDELGFGPVLSPVISPSGAMGYKAGIGMSLSF